MSRTENQVVALLILTCVVSFSDVNKIQEGIGDKLSNFVQWSSCCIAGIAIGFAYGWKLTLVILAVGPLLVISGGLMSYVSHSHGRLLKIV